MHTYGNVAAGCAYHRTFIQLVMYKGQHSHLLPENADNWLILYLLYHFQFEFLLLLCLTWMYYCVLQMKKKYRKT